MVRLRTDGIGEGRALGLAGLLATAAIVLGGCVSIQGTVQDERGRGVDGVTLTFSRGAGSVVTEADGYYDHAVPRGWSGTVSPSKPNCTFEPASRRYENVFRDYRGQHFRAEGVVESGRPSVKPTVSGGVRTERGEPIAGVVLTFDSGGPTARTDVDGRYTCQVPRAWFGTVKPSKGGHQFAPPARTIGPIVADRLGVNFTGKKKDGNGHIIKPKQYESPLTTEQKRALLDTLRISILNVGVVSAETLTLAAGSRTSEVCLRAVRSSLAENNFRIQHVTKGLAYEFSPAQVTTFAKANNLAFVVLLRGSSKEFDTFGPYYLFEAALDAKVVKSYRGELIAERRFTSRSKRSRDEVQAAEAALAAAGTDAVKYLTDEILRKRDRLHTTRLVLRKVHDLHHVDDILRELRRLPGIAYVSLEQWSERDKRAVVEIVHSTHARDNLGAYLETLKSRRVEVEQVTKDYVDAERD